MAKQIHFDLNKGDAEALQKQIETYLKSFTSKTTEFVRRLADVGIKMAMQNGGEFGSHIFYTKETKFSGNNATCTIIASGEEIEKSWVVKNGNVHSEKINALLMAEFGSGFKARNRWNDTLTFAGQGTLNKYGHAFDENGWYWEDLTGLHHSTGTSPSYPLYAAFMEMQTQVNTIAKEVFGNAKY